MNSRVGQQFGNYRLLRQLGEGGFAEVYLGEHIHLDTPAAIKILHTQLATDDIEPFRIEARTIARLIHPHIVRVLEFGVEGRIPYLVMDYAPNGTLRQRHPKGTQLPLDTIVGYVKQLADALQFAHDEKLIHRDVKPENMLIGRRQEILLSDFGIALVAQSSRYQATQDMAGTISYMAPEQIQAHPRPASDQYSLGIVTYEWLSGDRPFHGSFTEIAIKHSIVPPPSLREKLPTLPVDVEQVIMTALAKDYKERFGSIQAFSNALEQASRPDSAPSSPSIRPPVPLPPPQAVITPLDKAIPPTRSPLQTSSTESFIQTELVKQPSNSMPSITPAQSSSQAQVTPSQPPSSASHTPPSAETSSPTSDTVELPAQERGREKYGIERISPKTRPHVRIFDNFTFWLSASLGIPAFTLGTLAGGIHLNFAPIFLVILLGNVLGILPVALFASQGPRSGLRQMVLTRFSFGWRGASFIALLSTLVCIGWSATNMVDGVISTGLEFPIALVLLVVATILSVLGYKAIHIFARFAWIPVALAFIIIAVRLAPEFTLFFSYTPSYSDWGDLYALIDFGALVFTVALGWGICAANHNIRQPEDTPPRRVFWLTFIGIFLPVVLLEIIGAIAASLSKAFSLFHVVDVRFGFGGSPILMIAIAFGTIANTIPFLYNVGLSMQVLGHRFQRVNRSTWTIVGAILCLLLVVAFGVTNVGSLIDGDRGRFFTLAQLLACWIGPWTVIMLLEYLVFRNKNYPAENWNTRRKLPTGRAAVVSLLIGLVGFFLGLSESYEPAYLIPFRINGPLARIVVFADSSWLFSILFAGVAYLILRRMELKKSGR